MMNRSAIFKLPAFPPLSANELLYAKFQRRNSVLLSAIEHTLVHGLRGNAAKVVINDKMLAEARAIVAPLADAGFRRESSQLSSTIQAAEARRAPAIMFLPFVMATPTNKATAIGAPYAAFMFDPSTPDAKLNMPWGMSRAKALATIWNSVPSGTPVTILGPERADGAKFWANAVYVPVRLEASAAGIDPGVLGFMLSAQLRRV